MVSNWKLAIYITSLPAISQAKKTLLIGRKFLMGSASRVKPDLLAEKLLAIRTKLGLNQAELADELSCERINLRNSDISRYETGLREPPLPILLRYARLAKTTVEILIDDELGLPARFSKR